MLHDRTRLPNKKKHSRFCASCDGVKSVCYVANVIKNQDVKRHTYIRVGRYEVFIFSNHDMHVVPFKMAWSQPFKCCVFVPLYWAKVSKCKQTLDSTRTLCFWSVCNNYLSFHNHGTGKWRAVPNGTSLGDTHVPFDLRSLIYCTPCIIIHGVDQQAVIICSWELSLWYHFLASVKQHLIASWTSELGIKLYPTPWKE